MCLGSCCALHMASKPLTCSLLPQAQAGCCGVQRLGSASRLQWDPEIGSSRGALPRPARDPGFLLALPGSAGAGRVLTSLGCPGMDTLCTNLIPLPGKCHLLQLCFSNSSCRVTTEHEGAAGRLCKPAATVG